LIGKGEHAAETVKDGRGEMAERKGDFWCKTVREIFIPGRDEDFTWTTGERNHASQGYYKLINGN